MMTQPTVISYRCNSVDPDDRNLGIQEMGPSGDAWIIRTTYPEGLEQGRGVRVILPFQWLEAVMLDVCIANAEAKVAQAEELRAHGIEMLERMRKMRADRGAA